MEQNTPVEDGTEAAASRHEAGRNSLLYKLLIFMLMIFFAAALTGVFIILSELKRGTPEQRLASNCSEEPVLDLGLRLKAEISPSRLEQFYKDLGKNSAFAGTGNDTGKARHIEEQWKAFGLDDAYVSSYSVLLSYPDGPNEVSLVDEKGAVLFHTSRDVDLLPTFVTYSASGTVEGNMVFIHHGRLEDFDLLASLQVNISERILLARYGEISIRQKALNAQVRGAAGLIVYKDPIKDKFSPGFTPLWSSLKDDSGDPLTPYYPANDYAFREDMHDVGLPQIPVQTISSQEAEQLLRQTVPASQVPEAWKTHLNLGLQPEPEPDWKVRMEVKTANRMASISNIMGKIKGEAESKRYVIVGSRRDSCVGGWGTAVLMEIARVLGLLRQTKDWRPRRTIILASWSAGAYGNVGAHEWVEDMRRILDNRAVVYLNIDCPVTVKQGTSIAGVPSLHRVIREVTSLVLNSSHKEEIAVQRGGSDFEPFIYEAGIPYVHFSVAGNAKGQSLGNVTVVAQILAELINRFVDSRILPFDLEDYAALMKSQFLTFAQQYQHTLEENGVHLDPCLKNIEFLYDYAKELMLEIKAANLTCPNTDLLRRFNDVLMHFERYFLVNNGFPAKMSGKHIVLSPTGSRATSEVLFQTLYGAMEEIGNRTAAEEPEAWKRIGRMFAAVAFLFEQAYVSL